MITSEQTRLHIKGVKSAIRARVTRRGRYSITVAQPLSFLELESAIQDDDGREARIRSVSINYEGKTPHLVLDLIYDDTVWLDDLDDGSLDEMELSELEGISLPPAPTLHYEAQHSEAHPQKERRDQTVPYVVQRPSSTELTIGAPPVLWTDRIRDFFQQLTVRLAVVWG